MAKSASTLESLSAAELAAELHRRQKGVKRLVRQRERLATRLAELDKQIAVMGGFGPKGGMNIRKRPKNDANLVEALAAVLNGKTMSVTEVAKAVQKAGYQTTSYNFRTIVNQTLINAPKRFKRVARGQYTVK